jgi:hypothetical protein
MILDEELLKDEKEPLSSPSSVRDEVQSRPAKPSEAK